MIRNRTIDRLRQDLWQLHLMLPISAKGTSYTDGFSMGLVHATKALDALRGRQR